MAEKIRLSKEVSGALEQEKKIIFPYSPDQMSNPNNIYGRASSLLPVAPYNPMRGAKEHAFTMFADLHTKEEYSIVIPYRGHSTDAGAKDELATLQTETLQTEPLQGFYRHGYMLQRFASAEKVQQMLPLLIERIDSESKPFAKEKHPEDETKRIDLENQFYYLKLALLEKCEDDSDMQISPAMVKDLYTEAVTGRPRSLHAALIFDRRNGLTENEPSVREQVHDYLAPKLIDPELPDEQHIIDVLKWSYSDYQLQFDLLRESLLTAKGQKDIDIITRRFTSAMEIYDVTTYLQEYAQEHVDFQPKVDMVFSYLDKTPQEPFSERKKDPGTVKEMDEELVIRPFVEERQKSARTETAIDDERKFAGTAFEVVVDNRERNPQDVIKELSELTPVTLERELFRDFYRHMDMLINYGDPDFVAQFLPIIFRRGRLGKENEKLPKNEFIHPSNGLSDEIKADAYTKIMACLEVCEDDPKFRLPKDEVKIIWDAAWQTNPRFLRSALLLNDRNKMYGEAIDDMEKQVSDFCAGDIGYFLSHHREQADAFLEWSSVNPEIYRNTLIHSLISNSPAPKDHMRTMSTIQNVMDNSGISTRVGSFSFMEPDQTKIQNIVQRLAPFMGVEGIRKAVRDYQISLEDMPYRTNFPIIAFRVFEYMQLDPTQQLSTDLVRDVYENVDMVNYKPNEALLQAEVRLLEEQLGDAKEVLDVACGTGRHLLAIDEKEGRHVSGIDLVPKHIEHIKSLKEDADVRVGSWFDLPTPSETTKYDAIYCLGRSFAHNTTIPDVIACLQEMKSVMDPSGMILLDLPDPTKGDYKELTTQTLNAAQAKGMENILPGTIIDSPDAEHYFDRYIPDEEAFGALCELAGFGAEKVAEVPYKGKVAEENLNIYWKLTKRPAYEHLSVDRIVELVRSIRTSRQITPEDLPTSDQTMLSLSSRSADGA